MPKKKPTKDKKLTKAQQQADSLLSKADQQAIKEIEEDPKPSKVMHMLAGHGATREVICKVLADGLKAMKQVVCDGEIHEFDDHVTRLKFADTILEVIGEKKVEVPKGDLHYHFTSVLQLVEAYERGDPNALKDAQRIFDTASAELGQMATGPGRILPGSSGDQAAMETSDRPAGSSEPGNKGK